MEEVVRISYIIVKSVGIRRAWVEIDVTWTDGIVDRVGVVVIMKVVICIYTKLVRKTFKSCRVFCNFFCSSTLINMSHSSQLNGKEILTFW